MKIFLKRRRTIIEQLSKIRRKERKLQKELKELQVECNHEIIVKQKKKMLPGDEATREYTYCLICGEHLSPRKYWEEEIKEKIKNAACIDLDNYPNALQGNDENPAHTLYELFKVKYPEATNMQIAEKIKEKLEQSEESIK